VGLQTTARLPKLLPLVAQVGNQYTATAQADTHTQPAKVPTQSVMPPLRTHYVLQLVRLPVQEVGAGLLPWNLQVGKA
jgi:hypothetical protein